VSLPWRRAREAEDGLQRLAERVLQRGRDGAGVPSRRCRPMKRIVLVGWVKVLSIAAPVVSPVRSDRDG
jgi:hypothetical protein